MLMVTHQEVNSNESLLNTTPEDQTHQNLPKESLAEPKPVEMAVLRKTVKYVDGHAQEVNSNESLLNTTPEDQTHQNLPKAPAAENQTHENLPKAPAAENQTHENLPEAPAAENQTHENLPEAPAAENQTTSWWPIGAGVLRTAAWCAGIAIVGVVAYKVISHG